MSDPTDELAGLWTWFAETQFPGYSPLYEQVARSVAGDREILGLVLEAPPAGHLPIALLAAVHYLLLDGLDHPLAAVYAGRSDADPVPLFGEICRDHPGEILELLGRRRIQTNECGRSAVIGPGLSWIGARLEGPLALVDVGASAGLNLLCDRYRLDYGERGATGPADSPVRIDCEVRGGNPPLAERLPALAGRVGIDRTPVDLADPGDARWLLACVWPDTGRLDRTVAAIALAREDLPEVIEGDALETLPGVLEGLPPGTPAVVLTSWALAYLPVEERPRFVDVLEEAAGRRPLAWLSAEGAGTVEAFDGMPTASGPGEDPPGDILGAVLWEGGTRREVLLGTVHPHGSWLDWQADPA